MVAFKFLIFIVAVSLLVMVQTFTPHAAIAQTVAKSQANFVSEIYVKKSERMLYLVGRDGTVLKEYSITLGSNPIGHKEVEGDGRTPEGVYTISYKNPNSQFHLGLKISYPNSRDISRARARGESSGGNIFIHGGPPSNPNDKSRDWTRGCIGVTNQEIEEIYKYVGVGTKIAILP